MDTKKTTEKNETRCAISNQGLAVADVLQRCTRFEVHPDASHTGGQARHTSALAELPDRQIEKQ